MVASNQQVLANTKSNCMRLFLFQFYLATFFVRAKARTLYSQYMTLSAMVLALSLAGGATWYAWSHIDAGYILSIFFKNPSSNSAVEFFRYLYCLLVFSITLAASLIPFILLLSYLFATKSKFQQKYQNMEEKVQVLTIREEKIKLEQNMSLMPIELNCTKMKKTSKI